MVVRKLIVIVVLVLCIILCAGQKARAGGLELEDFSQINDGGFGNIHNSYAWSMAWFNGKLYVGTNPYFPYVLEYALNVTPDFFELDLRAEIWQYTPEANQWKLVHRSEEHEITINGFAGTTAVDQGYRGMAVYNGNLLVSTNVWVGKAARFLVSSDGENFEAVEFDPGMDFPAGVIPSSFRSLIPFKGKLYTTPCSTAVIGNAESGFTLSSEVPVVFESVELDLANKIFHFCPVSNFDNRRRFSRAGNLSKSITIFEMRDFNNYLYVGAANVFGFEVWKTDAKGSPPYTWRRIVKRGAGNWRSRCVVSMHPFNGALYVGSGNFATFASSSPAELIRIWPSDSIELVVGKTRRYQLRVLTPLSGKGEGFDHKYNTYFWRMADHEDWLYLGTYDSTIRYGSEEEKQEEAGFDLWKTFDGATWELVDNKGLSHEENYGVRNMLSTPEGLFVGTANPPLGAEVWLGK